MSTELRQLFALIDSYTETNIDLAFALMAENAEWRAAYERRYLPLLESMGDVAEEGERTLLLEIVACVNESDLMHWDTLIEYYEGLNDWAAVQEHFRRLFLHGKLSTLDHEQMTRVSFLLRAILGDPTLSGAKIEVVRIREQQRLPPAGEFRADLFANLRTLDLCAAPAWGDYFLPNLAYMPHLEKLRIADCDIDLSKYAFEAIEKCPLKRLELENVGLNEVPAWIYNLRLDWLSLDNNQITQIDSRLWAVAKHIFLRYNPIVSASLSPVDTRAITTELSLHSDNLPQFSLPATLVELYCTAPNPQTMELSEAFFEALPQLERCDLTNIRLQRLPAYLLRVQHKFYLTAQEILSCADAWAHYTSDQPLPHWIQVYAENEASDQALTRLFSSKKRISVLNKTIYLNPQTNTP